MTKTNISPKEVTGIILAGGKSSRFGSNKALFEYQGRKLVEYSIGILNPLCGNLLLSTNHPDKFSFTGLPCVKDIFQDCGPLGGIHAGLNHSTTEHHLVIGCDMPWLNTSLFSYILDTSRGYQVVMPVHQGFRETMASYYHKSCESALENALLEKKFKVFDAIAPLRTLYTVIDKESFYSDKLFANINYRNDID